MFGQFAAVGYAISTPQLLAYASDAVNEPVAELHDEMQRARTSIAWVMSLFADKRIDEARHAREEAILREDFDLAEEHRDRERQVSHEIGEASEIDLGRIDRLCERIIDAARRDLRS